MGSLRVTATVAAVSTLVQAVGWCLLSSLAILTYGCYIDLPPPSRTSPEHVTYPLRYYLIAYFTDSTCAPESDFISKRSTYGFSYPSHIMLISTIQFALNCLLTIVSLILIFVIPTCRKITLIVWLYPFVALSFGVSAMDVLATLTFSSDRDIADKIENDEVHYNTTNVLLILILIACRGFIFWILNVCFAIFLFILTCIHLPRACVMLFQKKEANGNTAKENGLNDIFFSLKDSDEYPKHTAFSRWPALSRKPRTAKLYVIPDVRSTPAEQTNTRTDEAEQSSIRIDERDESRSESRNQSVNRSVYKDQSNSTTLHSSQTANGTLQNRVQMESRLSPEVRQHHRESQDMRQHNREPPEVRQHYREPPEVRQHYREPPEIRQHYREPLDIKLHERESLEVRQHYREPPEGRQHYREPPEGRQHYREPPEGRQHYREPPEGRQHYREQAEGRQHYREPAEIMKHSRAAPEIEQNYRPGPDVIHYRESSDPTQQYSERTASVPHQREYSNLSLPFKDELMQRTLHRRPSANKHGQGQEAPNNNRPGSLQEAILTLRPLKQVRPKLTDLQNRY